jgi:hypothetical protein
MSRIFLSNSSLNNKRAVKVREWLAENGWDEVFLDPDPVRGLAPGERWQNALKQAADRCEVDIRRDRGCSLWLGAWNRAAIATIPV